MKGITSNPQKNLIFQKHLQIEEIEKMVKNSIFGKNISIKSYVN